MTTLGECTMNMEPAPVQLSGSWLAAIVGTLFHVLAWLAFLLTLMVCVPKVEVPLRDFNMKMPDSTLLVLQISHLMHSLGFASLLVVPLLMAADLIVLRALDRPDSTRILRELWSGLIFALPVLGLAMCVIASILPLAKLAEGLRR
jgi:type II secretory pathway component PulF